MATRTITLGDTTVSRVGLGTNRLTLTSANVAFVVGAVTDGLSHIDTAHLYTSGESEKTIGTALHLPLEGAIVATKGGYRDGEGRAEVLRGQIDESLRRLRTEMIDLYYLHRVHPGTPLEESMTVIAEAQEAGKIRHAGISEVSIDQIEQARAILPIAAVQNRYNLSDRGHDEVVDHCTAQGIVFVPYYPLQGAGGPAVEAAARRHDVTESQIALAWLLHRSPMMLPIPGTLSAGHLHENLAALDIELSDDEFAQIGGG
jgi:aryl-alcohol dehydrogenase-like predicted oxidoreductase